MRRIFKVLLILTVVSLVATALLGRREIREWLVVQLFYREALLPREQIHKDIAYWNGPDADRRKHKLDLYVPSRNGWPILIFVHGGGWSSGDKSLRYGTADPYGNIGRFYSGQGVGVAVINYRLQPSVTWQEQARDVARAVAWMRRHAGDYQGDTGSIFLSGHSAGAQLAVRVALDREFLQEVGLTPGAICGVISVSGTPFDLTDEKTYELGTDPAFFEKHFRSGDNGAAWKREASSTPLITPSAPPFLLMHGRWEWKGLQRQNQVMYQTLKEAGVPAKLVVTPWEEHYLIVAAMSHPGKRASARILDFIRDRKCP